MQYQKELQVAKHAIKLAGDLLMKNFGKQGKVSFKQKHEIVTNTDKLADHMISKIIQTSFSNHNILSEEFKHKKQADAHLWIVDPLDGTNNYAHKLPLFAVCIALAEGNVNSFYDLKLGVVYLPYFKEMFWAIKGRGAYLNNKKIKISNTSDIKNSFILKCHGYDKREKALDHKIFGKIDKVSGATRRLGVAGLELAFVAKGKVDGGYIIGTRPWDSAAGALIVREAGGSVTNFKGEDWNIFDKNILFSNGKIHRQLLKIINN